MNINELRHNTVEISKVLAENIGPLILKGLSPREAEVIVLTYEGFSNAAIALALSDIHGVRCTESAVCNARQGAKMKLIFLQEEGELE